VIGKKGIILAGGNATRLRPATTPFGKAFLPVSDKPMIFYPLRVLLQSGVRDILIVTAPRDTALLQALLGDGSQFGVNISYIEQPVARGIADAFILAESFIGGDPVCLILCDNFFYGEGLSRAVAAGWKNAATGATIFCHYVDNPSSYGVADFDAAGQVTRLVEKPATFVSNWAVTGLYIYDSRACAFAKTLTPSKRGELEITDLNSRYLEQGALHVVKFDKSFSWFDLGTYPLILEAGNLIVKMEERDHVRIGCPYITAYQAGYIDKQGLLAAASSIGESPYAATLKELTSFPKGQ
jgi:glucose-1-phosphate thymidylyltransferase